MGDFANAVRFQSRTEAAVETNIALNLVIGSERQKLLFLNTVSERTDRAISLNMQLMPGDPDASALAALVFVARENVRDTETPKPRSKKGWELTEGAFRQLLGWLDEGKDSGGEKYLEMRRRLVSFFDRKNCLAPDELTDETLSRVARRLEEEGGITDRTPAHYCYIVR